MVQGTGNAPGEEITIDGPHRGDLRADVVRITKGGSVFGNIMARVVKVSGRVEGEIDAKEFYASATARVRGIVRHELIGLMPGATFSAVAEKVAFTAFDTVHEPKAVSPAEPAIARIHAPVEAVKGLPFRPGVDRPVWVPQGGASSQPPALSEERRARMMENVKSALADVAAGLSSVAPAAQPPGTTPMRRVLPSLLG